MAKKFPDKLPPKGTGRVDDKHQIALLTDFEIAALNTLKNRDKERGFPSGSGPEIQALAAMNSRPFEFVNYRGERIPSLNDFAGAGIDGGSGERNEKQGEDEARNQQSDRDPEVTNTGPKRNKDGLLINEKGQIILGGRAGSGKSKRDHETDEEFASREHPMFSNKELAALRGGDNNLHRNPGETAEAYVNRLNNYAEQNKGESTINQSEAQVWTDWQGNEYDNPADAAEANQGYRDTKFSEISEYEHEGIGQEYVDAYQQQLSDAYDAAYRGVEMDIGEAGYFTGDEFTNLENAVTGQEEWLEKLGSNYEQQASDYYDTWYQENMDAINALGSKEEVDAYNWTDANFDLDLTGGSGFESGNEYDADYIPEFYEGFRKEYGEDYSAPTMPDSWGGNPENIEEASEGEGEGERSNTRTVKRKSKPSVSPGINPFSKSGSARYY